MCDLRPRESGVVRELVLEELTCPRDGDAVKAVLLELPAIALVLDEIVDPGGRQTERRRRLLDCVAQLVDKSPGDAAALRARRAGASELVAARAAAAATEARNRCRLLLSSCPVLA
jgi:hypothetical protein